MTDRAGLIERLRMAAGETSFIPRRAILDEAADALTTHTAVMERVKAALTPFANFFEGFKPWLADDLPLTLGSPMARKQLTVGDFRNLAEALSALKELENINQGAFASQEACIKKLKETLQWIVNASCQYHNTDSGFIISGIEQHTRNVLKELESK